jgi:hypothetical protein
MEPHWRQTKRKTNKMMDGECAERLTNYENKNWKQKAINREAWDKLVEKAETHTGL